MSMLNYVSYIRVCENKWKQPSVAKRKTLINTNYIIIIDEEKNVYWTIVNMKVGVRLCNVYYASNGLNCAELG